MTNKLSTGNREWIVDTGEIEIDCEGFNSRYIWITKEELQEMLDAINEQQEQDNESN